jgi:hypothetical protein
LNSLLRVDLAVIVEGLEGTDDNIVLIGSTGHAVGEQGQQLGEVDGAGGLIDHGVELLLRDQTAQRVEGGAQIVLAEDAVLVAIHHGEALLEFSHLLLAEHGEHIRARALGCLLGATAGLACGLGGRSRSGGGCGFRFWCRRLLLGGLLLLLLFLIRLENKIELSVIKLSFKENCFHWVGGGRLHNCY